MKNGRTRRKKFLIRERLSEREFSRTYRKKTHTFFLLNANERCANFRICAPCELSLLVVLLFIINLFLFFFLLYVERRTNKNQRCMRPCTSERPSHTKSQERMKEKSQWSVRMSARRRIQCTEYVQHPEITMHFHIDTQRFTKFNAIRPSIHLQLWMFFSFSLCPFAIRFFLSLICLNCESLFSFSLDKFVRRKKTLNLTTSTWSFHSSSHGSKRQPRDARVRKKK